MNAQKINDYLLNTNYLPNTADDHNIQGMQVINKNKYGVLLNNDSSILKPRLNARHFCFANFELSSQNEETEKVDDRHEALKNGTDNATGRGSNLQDNITDKKQEMFEGIKDHIRACIDSLYKNFEYDFGKLHLDMDIVSGRMQQRKK